MTKNLGRPLERANVFISDEAHVAGAFPLVSDSVFHHPVRGLPEFLNVTFFGAGMAKYVTLNLSPSDARDLAQIINEALDSVS